MSFFQQLVFTTLRLNPMVDTIMLLHEEVSMHVRNATIAVYALGAASAGNICSLVVLITGAFLSSAWLLSFGAFLFIGSLVLGAWAWFSLQRTREAMDKLRPAAVAWSQAQKAYAVSKEYGGVLVDKVVDSASKIASSTSRMVSAGADTASRAVDSGKNSVMDASRVVSGHIGNAVDHTTSTAKTWINRGQQLFTKSETPKD